MSFISLEFLIFVPLVLLLYQACPAQYRTILLLAASYVFYASWSIHYIALILISSVTAYVSGLQFEKTSAIGARRFWLWISIVVILGQLFLFKYFDFFLENINWFAGADFELLQVLLPIGISFYSLQTLGYVIDVYRGKFPAEKTPQVFFLYVCFYPQLVAGPIERARHLIPQLRKPSPITQENFRAGLIHIAWGLALKLIVGDRLAVSGADVFARPELYSSPEVLVAMAFQWIHVFCDFYGYSEMARGLAIMFGINLIRNFENPFLATNTRAFWQRWHVSLTKWVFDYLYFPLVGKKSSQLRRSVGLVITMGIVGFWHGASYNFILFGLYQAFVMLIQDQTRKVSPIKRSRILSIITNNLVIMGSAPLFMTPNLEQAINVYGAFLGLNMTGDISTLNTQNTIVAVGFFLALMIVETRYRGVDRVAMQISKYPAYLRWTGYFGFTLLLLTFGMVQESEFVYFQF